MRISVQYSTMIVKNLEESVVFYRDILGFTEGDVYKRQAYYRFGKNDDEF